MSIWPEVLLAVRALLLAVGLGDDVHVVAAGGDARGEAHREARRPVHVGSERVAAHEDGQPRLRGVVRRIADGGVSSGGSSPPWSGAWAGPTVAHASDALPRDRAACPQAVCSASRAATSGWCRASWKTPKTAIAAGDEERGERPERRVLRLAEHEHADADGDDRVDDGEPGDDEVGRPDGVRGLHEVEAAEARSREPDAAEHRQPVELARRSSRLMTVFAIVATKP